MKGNRKFVTRSLAVLMMLVVLVAMVIGPTPVQAASKAVSHKFSVFKYNNPKSDNVTKEVKGALKVGIDYGVSMRAWVKNDQPVTNLVCSVVGIPQILKAKVKYPVTFKITYQQNGKQKSIVKTRNFVCSQDAFLEVTRSKSSLLGSDGGLRSESYTTKSGNLKYKYRLCAYDEIQPSADSVAILELDFKLERLRQ